MEINIKLDTGEISQILTAVQAVMVGAREKRFEEAKAIAEALETKMKAVFSALNPVDKGSNN